MVGTGLVYIVTGPVYSVTGPVSEDTGTIHLDLRSNSNSRQQNSRVWTG
jgi:hypothetical protein